MGVETGFPLILPPGYTMLDVLVTDNLTGKQVKCQWSLQQFQAVAVLAIAGDDFFSDVQDPNAYLYEIAEKALIGFPSEVRPIP